VAVARLVWRGRFVRMRLGRMRFAVVVFAGHRLPLVSPKRACAKAEMKKAITVVVMAFGLRSISKSCGYITR
jgi:hypothetical protein